MRSSRLGHSACAGPMTTRPPGSCVGYGRVRLPFHHPGAGAPTQIPSSANPIPRMVRVGPQLEMSGSIIRSSDLIAARIRAVRTSAFWASSPARCSRRSWDPPGSGHEPPRTGIPGQSAHVHNRGWHQRAVPVTIGVPDGPLVRLARPLGYCCGENGGSWRRRCRRVSGRPTAAGHAADAVIAADDGSISDPAPTCTASADVRSWLFDRAQWPHQYPLRGRPPG